MTGDNRLSESYTATLIQLKAKEGNGLVLGMKMLMWMFCLYLGRWLLVSISVIPRGGVRISGSKSGKHCPVKVTLIILSRSCHSRGVFVRSPTTSSATCTAEAPPRCSSLTHSSYSKIPQVCLTYLYPGFPCTFRQLFTPPPRKCRF